MLSKPESVAIYLEVGAKRTFASAVDWPGWSRVARSEQEAITALASYGDRYKAVVRSAAPKFTAPKDTSEFKIVKRLKGNAGTDFGVPSLGLPSDDEPVAAPSSSASRGSSRHAGARSIARPSPRKVSSCAKVRAAAVAISTR